MQITLRNNTTNYTRYYDDVEVVDSNPLHQIIKLDATELIDGEYTLTLFNNSNQVIVTELLVIGKNKIKEYKTKKNYIYYAKK